MLRPDLEIASCFLRALDPNAKAFCFQTFDDAKAKRSDLVRTRYASLDDIADELATLNDAGAGIFVTVNATNGEGRKKDDIIRVRALFCDFDEEDAAQRVEDASRILTPSMVVESSPGLRHAYWCVDDLPIGDASPWLKRLSVQFGSDPRVTDIARVLRLPGFHHRKSDPVPVRLLSASGKRYCVADLEAAFGKPAGANSTGSSAKCKTVHAGGNSGEIVQEGGRNAALVSEACAFRRKGWGEDAMIVALLELNRSQFRPPLPENEVRAVAKWACGKYEPTPGADISEMQGVDDWGAAIDGADGDPGAITAVVHKLGAAPGLSEIERAALFKRAAKAAGCSLGAIRAEAAKGVVDQPVASATVLPLVRVSAGDFSGAVDDAVNLLPNLDLYQQGGRLVEVLPSVGGSARVEPVELPHLAYLLSRSATWRRAGAEGMDTATSPDRDLVAAVITRKWWVGVRPLAGIARQPILQNDGSLALAGGYCPETMHLMAFSQDAFPAWEGTAKEAVDLLLDLLHEFPFVSDEDRAAAVAGMLTGALRKSLDKAPGFFVKAHAASSGKTYLSSLLAMFAGSRSAPCAWGEGAAEQRKALLSLLLDSPDAVVFDNLERDLSSPHFARALTDSVYRDRALGQSKSPEASAQVLFIGNGNNCGPTGDLCRRFLTLRLDVATEQPFSRKFSSDPVAQVEAARGRYVMTALAIVQGWIAAGSPRAPLKTIASYDAWSDWVRQPLVWLGLPDPGACLLESAAHGDPDREMLGRVLRLWFMVFGGAPIMVREILRVLSGCGHDENVDDLREALTEIAGERGDEINPRRLGWWLKAREGRIVTGHKLVKFEGGERTHWLVARV